MARRSRESIGIIRATARSCAAGIDKQSRITARPGAVRINRLPIAMIAAERRLLPAIRSISVLALRVGPQTHRVSGRERGGIVACQRNGAARV